MAPVLRYDISYLVLRKFAAVRRARISNHETALHASAIDSCPPQPVAVRPERGPPGRTRGQQTRGGQSPLTLRRRPAPRAAGSDGADETVATADVVALAAAQRAAGEEPASGRGKPWQRRRKGPGRARKGLAGPARSRRRGPTTTPSPSAFAYPAVDYRHMRLAGRSDGRLHAGLALEALHRERGADIVQVCRQHAHVARAVVPAPASAIAGGESARASGTQRGDDGAVHGVMSSRGRVGFATAGEPPRGKNAICRAEPPANHDEKNNISEGENTFSAWKWVFSPIASVLPARKQFHAGD